MCIRDSAGAALWTDNVAKKFGPPTKVPDGVYGNPAPLLLAAQARIGCVIEARDGAPVVKIAAHYDEDDKPVVIDVAPSQMDRIVEWWAQQRALLFNDDEGAVEVRGRVTRFESPKL